jgi:flagellar hook-associated protein 2
MGTRIGAITFGGLSSGLPTEEIIGKLLELSRRPIEVLEKQRDDYSTRLDLYRDLNSKTTALRNVLRRLDNMADVIRPAGSPAIRSAFEEFRKYEAVSSDETRAGVSVGRGATPGSLVFSIEQLARQHRSLSGAYTSATDVVTAGGGSLSIQIGSGTATNIALAAGTTVQGAIDAVNATGIDATAFLVDDGQGAVRIAIVGDKTGADQSLVIGNDFGQTFTTTQTAQDARLVLDPDSALPVAIVSSSNKFENVIQGLTIEARSITAAAERVTVTVQTSTEKVKESLVELVDAYNAIADVILEQNRIDPTTSRGGPLLGDSAMINLGQSLGLAMARTYGSGRVTSAGQLGIQVDRNGRLTLDEARLDNALEADFEGVASFISGENAFADQIRKLADSFIDIGDPDDPDDPDDEVRAPGILTARISGTTDRIADLKRSIERAEDRLETYEANLVAQFAALERTLSEFQQQSNFLTSFLLGQSS